MNCRKLLSTLVYMLLLMTIGIFSVPFAGITDTAEKVACHSPGVRQAVQRC